MQSIWLTTQPAGREPARDAQAKAPGGEEIMVAEEMERAVFDLDPERDAEAAADMLLEPGRPGEALAAVDDLREAAAAAIDPSPDLAAAGRILGDATIAGRSASRDSGSGPPISRAAWARMRPARLIRHSTISPA